MNIFKQIPDNLDEEVFEDIINSDNVRVERIVSLGHSSPDEGWYIQDEHEWVMVLSGFGVIEFAGGRVVRLEQGDYLNIPAHCKHKVSETASDEPTIWLAVFYR